jgi:hypothetical protein
MANLLHGIRRQALCTAHHVVADIDHVTLMSDNGAYPGRYGPTGTTHSSAGALTWQLVADMTVPSYHWREAMELAVTARAG